MRQKLVLFTLFFIFSNLFVFAQITVLDDTNVTELRQKTFNRVWGLVNERHFDPNFGGVDWKKVGETYQPKALSAKTDDEFHAVLNQMLGELNQSHFSIYTKNAELNSTKCNDGVIGIELKIVENQPVIYQVAADSTAAQAGLKVGFALSKIDDKTISEILQPVEEVFTQRRMTEAMKKVQRERTLMRSVCGKPETSVKLEVLNKLNAAQLFEVRRFSYKGEIAKVADGIPAFRLLFEAKRLENNIGYISFNVWIPQQAEKVQAAIGSMTDATAIIIDLRGNAGGQGNLVNNVGGTMIKQIISFGKTKTRFGEGNFWVLPQNKIYNGQVVILTDYGTGSTSEIFTAGMKEIGRAKIIGERTAGAVLPATIERLPTGASFMYAIADYRSPSGMLIEGKGVEPDLAVELTRQSLLAGRDLQLEAAIKEVSK